MVVRVRRVAVIVLLGALASVLATQSPAAAAPPSDRTDPSEAALVDRVDISVRWYRCFGDAQCATVQVPLDYSNPKAGTTEVALLRRVARKPGRRIGSLFLNPGGPGGSATEIAYFSPYFLKPELLDKFDIVGMDPRGTNFSDNVRCFRDIGAQADTLDPFYSAFPLNSGEERRTMRAAREFGDACNTYGRPLSASMSTAQVARDMDVVRRALGDSGLTYLGFSYGTYLGEVYANLFPDRIRAMVIDGVLNPVEWAGTPKTANTPVTDRLGSADGAIKALREAMVRCKKAGKKFCPIAGPDPLKTYDDVAQQLRRNPLVFSDDFGEFRFTYADFVSYTLSALYGPYGPEFVAYLVADLQTLLSPSPPRGAVSSARASMRKLSADLVASSERSADFGFPYFNGLEAFTAVLCSDSLNPAWPRTWVNASDPADARAPYFGRLWLWASVPCANKTWGATDANAYRGPFTKRTSKTVLVVGSLWDPATRYEGAVSTASLMPNSRLISNDNWGHTAMGSSGCIDHTIRRYLVNGTLPAAGKTCVGDYQPFRDDIFGEGESEAARAARVSRPAGRILPPFAFDSTD